VPNLLDRWSSEGRKMVHDKAPIFLLVCIADIGRVAHFFTFSPS
jgi:hypothetical protein